MLRENNIDLLRVFACILVIIVHICAPILSNTDLNGNIFKINLIIDSFARVCVPLFVMITGRYLVKQNGHWDSTKYIKNINKIVRPLIIWSLIYISIYFIYKILRKEDIIYKTIIDNILNGKPYYHLWYLYMILGLYVIIPFLNISLTILNSQQIKIIAWSCVLFGLIHQAFNYFNKIDDFFGLWFIDYIGYALLGYIYKNNAVKSKYLFLIGYVSSSILIFILSYIVYMQNQRLPFFNYLSIFVVFGSYFIYRFFDNLTINSKIINNISNHSFGIYLIHPLFILALSSFMKKSFLAESITLLLTFVLSYFSVYILSRNYFLKKYLF